MRTLNFIGRVLGFPAPAMPAYIPSPDILELRRALDRLQAERDAFLREKEDNAALFEGAIASCPIPSVVVKTVDGVPVFANGAFQANFGYSLGELQAGAWKTMISASERSAVREQMNSAAVSGAKLVIKYNAVTRDGVTVPVEAEAVPIRRGSRLLGYVVRLVLWKSA